MQAGRNMLTTFAVLAAASLATSVQAHENDKQTAKTHGSGLQQEADQKPVTTKGIEKQTSNMVLVGELVDTRDVTLKGVDEEKHRLLKIKPTNASQAVIVDIGRQDPATSFGLMKGDRVIAVGKSARINDRPVLFAKSIGELYPVGRIGSAAADKTGSGTSTGSKDSKDKGAAPSTAAIDPPDTRGVDEIVVWFDSNNLRTDQYGSYDEDFVWVTTDPAYLSWYPAGNPTAWNNDNWEKPHWDVWGYDDADELGLFDW